MSPNLEHLLTELRRQPPDRDLGGLTVEVNEALAERAAIAGQT